MRLMEGKADKQTITKTNDASQIQKTITKKKSVPTGDRRKFSKLLQKIKSASTKVRTMSIQFMYSCSNPDDGLVFRAFRCGLGNTGSNPGLDR